MISQQLFSLNKFMDTKCTFQFHWNALKWISLKKLVTSAEYEEKGLFKLLQY